MKSNICKEKLEELKKNKVLAEFAKREKVKMTEELLTNNYYEILYFVSNFKNCPNKTDLEHCVQNIKGKQDALHYSDGYIYNVLKDCECLKYYEKKWIKNVIYSTYKIDESIVAENLDENLLEKNANYRKFLFKKINEENIGKLKKGVYFFGEPGIGKTYILKCIAYYLASINNDVAIITISDLLAKVKEDFKVDFLKKFKDVKYLFIDDLGSEVLTEWSRENILFNLINYRYENNLITFFSSNYKIEDLEKKYIISFNDIDKLKYDMSIQRITTRIVAMAGEAPVGGVRLRKKLKVAINPNE